MEILTTKEGVLNRFVAMCISQFEVIHALTIRETRTRFGAHKAGFLWALAEPTMMILTFYILFALANRPAPVGMTLFSFVATGICPFLIFTNAVNRVADSISGNKALLVYPQVHPLDIVIARVYLEFCTYFVVFVILMLFESIYLQQFEVGTPLLVLTSFAFASLLGAGLGLIFLGLSQLSNSVDRIRSTIMRPFFWISGIFFTAAGLPPTARDHMLYNPLLHVVEQTRAGWFVRYDDTYVDVTYMFTWTVGLLLIGLLLERVVRRNIDLT